MNIELNMDELSFGDIEDFEDFTGRTIEDAFSEVMIRDEKGEKILDEKGRPLKKMNCTAKDMVAIIWIAGRQQNPDFSLDDARKTKFKEIKWVRTPDPKESAENSV